MVYKYEVAGMKSPSKVCFSTLPEYSTVSALTAGDVRVVVAPGREVRALQGH